jgi:hypothetical protein
MTFVVRTVLIRVFAFPRFYFSVVTNISVSPWPWRKLPRELLRVTRAVSVTHSTLSNQPCSFVLSLHRTQTLCRCISRFTRFRHQQPLSRMQPWRIMRVILTAVITPNLVLTQASGLECPAVSEKTAPRHMKKCHISCGDRLCWPSSTTSIVVFHFLVHSIHDMWVLSHADRIH